VKPPSSDALLRLPAPHWNRVVGAVRASVDETAPPRLRQLAATPTAKLRDGRSRRDLCVLLAEDATLWEATATHLRQDSSGRTALRQLAAPDTPSPRDSSADLTEERVRFRERESRLKERSRRLREERDAARRRADGLEGRLRTVTERVEDLEQRLEKLRAQRDELAGALEEAEDERRREVERVRRHHASHLEEMDSELRRLRRELEERRAQGRREEQARQAAEERAQKEVQRYQRAATGSTGLRRPGLRLIVDGYNVTKQHRGHADLEHQRAWLVNVCDGFAAQVGTQCLIVFDGQDGLEAPAGHGRRTRVVFSAGDSADDRIVGLVSAVPEGEPVAVVPDDRELADRVRGRGADVYSTSAFIAVAE
jgi:TolA-binding protein